MAFHIRSRKAGALLRELRAVTGESLTEAVAKALAERLEREKRRAAAQQDPLGVLEGVWARLASVPKLDHRSDDEILGYTGLPQ